MVEIDHFGQTRLIVVDKTLKGFFMTQEAFSPRQTASTLAALVNVILPGDSLFPSAADVGTHLWLMEKLHAEYDTSVIDRVIHFLNQTQDFAAQAPAEQIEIVARFERDEPDLFGFIRSVIYLGYYQTLPVVQAVRQLGRDYNQTPQPSGYELAPFDPSTLPAVRRGRYIATEDVSRVDLSGIDMGGLKPVVP
jgi:hypothetical protein